MKKSPDYGPSKELLVMAGELIMRLVGEHGTSLIPIDSEHAALFQCLHGIDRDNIAQLVVTGSGGPLWKVPTEQFWTLTQEQVLAHPTWSMGRNRKPLKESSVRCFLAGQPQYLLDR